jgi:hypothetical protein
MPHAHAQLDNVTLFSSLMAGTIIASADVYSPIEVFPLSAGVSGAMLSVLRGRSQKDPKENRVQIISSFLCGVTASLFIAPAVVQHALSPMFGPATLATKTLVHLFIGLSGTTIIDWFLDHRKAMTAAAVKKVLGKKFQELSDNETSPPAVCEVLPTDPPSTKTPPTVTPKHPVE